MSIKNDIYMFDFIFRIKAYEYLVNKYEFLINNKKLNDFEYKNYSEKLNLYNKELNNHYNYLYYISNTLTVSSNNKSYCYCDKCNKNK
jgi:hypothetical protein